MGLTVETASVYDSGNWTLRIRHPPTASKFISVSFEVVVMDSNTSTTIVTTTNAATTTTNAATTTTNAATTTTVANSSPTSGSDTAVALALLTLAYLLNAAK